MKLPDYRTSTSVAMADFSSSRALTREDYLRDYPLCWQQLLLTGRSARARSESRTLSDDESCHKLQKRVV